MSATEKLMSRIAYDLERRDDVSSAECQPRRDAGGPVIYLETIDHDLYTLSIAKGAPE